MLTRASHKGTEGKMPLPKGLKNTKQQHEKNNQNGDVNDDLKEIDISFSSSSPNLSDLEQIKVFYEEANSFFYVDSKKAITLFRAVVHECTRIGQSALPSSPLLEDDSFFITYGNSLFSLAVLEGQEELFRPSMDQYEILGDDSLTEKSFLIGRGNLFLSPLSIESFFDENHKEEKYFEVLDILMKYKEDLVEKYRVFLIKHLLLSEETNGRIVELFLDFSSEFIEGEEPDLEDPLLKAIIQRLSVICQKLEGLEGKKLEAEFYLLLGSVLEMGFDFKSDDFVGLTTYGSNESNGSNGLNGSKGTSKPVTADDAYEIAKKIYDNLSKEYKVEVPQMILDL